MVHDAFPVLYIREPGAFETVVEPMRVNGYGRTERCDEGVETEVVVSARDGLLLEALSRLG